MDVRTRFHAIMNYEPADRCMWLAPWLGFPGTLERWHQEGCPADSLGPFEFDSYTTSSHWFSPHPTFENQVLEETDRHVLFVNDEGILMRQLKDNPMASMPQFVRFPVETRDDFRTFAKERLQPDVAARIGDDWVKKLKELRAMPGPLWVIADRWGGFFGPLRNLMGVENLCMAFYTNPALVEEMMDTIADYVIAMASQVLDRIEVDMFGLWEDMAYNHGPLIGPELVRKYMLPRYKRVTEYIHGRGVKWICLDSDGRVDTLIPVWMDGGIDLLYPFEVAAGMDVVACRKQFGKDLRMYMGIDKRALAQGPSAIDREIKRVKPLIDEGGYLPNVDHSLPPDISYANFCYYVEHLGKAVGL